MSSSRFSDLSAWTAAQHGLKSEEIRLAPAGGDASFRRYFRLTLPNGATQVVMDAPPAQEDSAPFLAIARRWHAANLPVPQVHAADLDAGFLLLDDLGDTPLQARFGDSATTLPYLHRAMALIAALQNRASPEALPAYDAALLGRELDLFPEWCLTRFLDLPTPPEWPVLRQALIDAALEQRVVSVHRDFDAMNLMVKDDHLYMIDFQDAVAGPLSYDVISLLSGRYRRFDAATYAALIEHFYREARRDGRLPGTLSAEAFLTQCHAMAAQRSLKVLGIFCRLTLRDGKHGYLERLPHFLDHLTDSLAALPAHANVLNWLETQLRPAITARLSALEIAE